MVDKERTIEESDVVRQGQTITARYTLEIPNERINEYEEAHPDHHDDVGVQVAKMVARQKFKEDHDVPFNNPDMVAERDEIGGIETVRFAVVATK